MYDGLPWNSNSSDFVFRGYFLGVTECIDQRSAPGNSCSSDVDFLRNSPVVPYGIGGYRPQFDDWVERSFQVQ